MKSILAAKIKGITHAICFAVKTGRNETRNAIDQFLFQADGHPQVQPEPIRKELLIEHGVVKY